MDMVIVAEEIARVSSRSGDGISAKRHLLPGWNVLRKASEKQERPGCRKCAALAEIKVFDLDGCSPMQVSDIGAMHTTAVRTATGTLIGGTEIS